MTSHPAMSRHRSKNPKWKMKRFGHLKAHERKVHRTCRIGMLAETSSTSAYNHNRARSVSYSLGNEW